jgi:hypothetical protein
MGNGSDDISSEGHFENLKTKRGSYFLLEPFVFVQIFEFYLVTQDDPKTKAFRIAVQYFTFNLAELLDLLDMCSFWHSLGPAA